MKMAVSRLTHVAADMGIKEERPPSAGRSTEGSDYRLFPCLRASADLLMMPKQVLADAEIRWGLAGWMRTSGRAGQGPWPPGVGCETCTSRWWGLGGECTLGGPVAEAGVRFPKRFFTRRNRWSGLAWA